ncbi:MAG: hypothetical protein ACE14L_12205 [Terriglobales bacterium]
MSANSGRRKLGLVAQVGPMLTLNILTLYMVMVFATWSYFLDKSED